MPELNGSAASLADFIWRNAEDLWGDFKHTDFGKVIALHPAAATGVRSRINPAGGR